MLASFFEGVFFWRSDPGFFPTYLICHFEGWRWRIQMVDLLILVFWRYGSRAKLNIGSVVGLWAILRFASLMPLPSFINKSQHNISGKWSADGAIGPVGPAANHRSPSGLYVRFFKDLVTNVQQEHVVQKNYWVLNELFILTVRKILGLLNYLILRVEGAASQKMDLLKYSNSQNSLPA